MVPNSISCRHDTGTSDNHVWSGPYFINRVCTTKEGRPQWLVCECANHLVHCETASTCQRLAQAAFLDVLICIYAHYQSFPLFVPLLELLYQIIVESLARACEVFFLLNEVPSVLLVH